MMCKPCFHIRSAPSPYFPVRNFSTPWGEEKKYTTGEFAEYFGIKKDTLFYYDKIKLFYLAGIKANGYRYYTSSRIGTFWTLLSFREIGVPVKVLQKYFREPSPVAGKFTKKAIQLCKHTLYCKSRRKRSYQKKGGQYAVYYHKGSYDSISEVYPHILNDIEHLGFTIAGDAYEEYLIAETATNHINDYITKIAIKVE